MKSQRRAFTQQALAITLGVYAGSAASQAYPARPIKLIVGYSPGGAVDVIARAVAQHLSASLGQAIVVENKPGAGTNLAMKALIESPPDGYTMMLVANAAAANPALYKPAPFDPQKDLTPISVVGRVPVVIAANSATEVSSLTRLIALSKVKPGSVQYGTPGNGSTPHLAVELFQRAAGIEMTHVPYKGGSQAINDTLGGHIPVVAVNALEALPHIRSGKLKGLAVLTSKRAAILPDLPTIAESGFAGFEASVWYGLVAPAGLPPAIATRLHAEMQKALALPEVRNVLTQAGGEVTLAPRNALATLLASETARYAKLIRDARIQPD
jgi:tripartite-type tricarboxylate transporter receptor subunit TctC